MKILSILLVIAWFALMGYMAKYDEPITVYIEGTK